MLIAILAVMLVAYPAAFGFWLMGASLALSLAAFYGAGLVSLIVFAIWSVKRIKA